jgi:hypothetical protein
MVVDEHGDLHVVAIGGLHVQNEHGARPAHGAGRAQWPACR